MINKAFENYTFDKDSLYVHRPYIYRNPETVEPGQELSYGQLERATPNQIINPKQDIYYMPKLFSGSDYSGDLVNMSNFTHVLQKFHNQSGHEENFTPKPDFIPLPGAEFIHAVYGGYGTYAIAFNVSKIEGDLAEETIDLFENLDQYPVADEDLMGNLEFEAEVRAWSSWVDFDMKRLIEKRYDGQLTIDQHDPTLQDLFHQLCEKTNQQLENDGSDGMYIDMDLLIPDRETVESCEAWQSGKASFITWEEEETE